MPDRVMPGPVQESASEAVCIHTRKIYDSCKDKDYPPWKIFSRRAKTGRIRA